LRAPWFVSQSSSTFTIADAPGKSRMLNDQPELQADLMLAGNLLVRWLRDGTDLGCPFNLDD
jgi:hypothetical protein